MDKCAARQDFVRGRIIGEAQEMNRVFVAVPHRNPQMAAI
jgi:hypothetical protein